MTNSIKIKSNILKYCCNFCSFKTDDKKEFLNHIGWTPHKVAEIRLRRKVTAMIKLQQKDMELLHNN